MQAVPFFDDLMLSRFGVKHLYHDIRDPSVAKCAPSG